MKKTSRSLALKIAQIIEEHTSKEIAEAIKILEDAGSTSGLLHFLSSAPVKRAPRILRKPLLKSDEPPEIDQVTSKAVARLEKTDPQKYRVLSEFEALLRKGQVLPTNDALRRLGETISKDFRTRSSRKENISALMVALASLQKSDLERLIESVLDSSNREKVDQYRNLANYLMHGKRE